MPSLAQTDRLNILHIASWYPSRISPQNGNFIERHIEAIGQLTHSYVLHVVSDPHVEKREIINSKNTDYQSVTVIYPKGNIFNRFALNKKAHRIGYQEVKSLCSKFDLVHVHVMFPAIAFAKELASEMNIPIVVTEHATAYHDHHPVTYNLWQRLFLKRYGRNVKRYFPVSKDLQKSMMKKGIRGDYQVIPNVVNTDLFLPAVKGTKSDTFHFIHISSLKDEHKNVSGLLSVFAEVASEHPQARLTIIGNDHHEQIQRYIHLLKMVNQVDLLKEIPIEEVAHHLQQSHALLLFSNYENAPCVISEAHCVGLPVIATKVGGISEMVDDSNGLLVASGDVFGMYAAMCKMIESYDRFDPQAIHKASAEKYGYDEVGGQYLAAIKEVLHRN